MNVTLIGMGSGQPENLTLQAWPHCGRPTSSWAHGVCWQFYLPAAPRTAPPPTAPTSGRAAARLPAQRTPCWSTAATPAFTPARPP